MKRREVVIGIILETDATMQELRRQYLATICDKLTLAGKYGRIGRVTVLPVQKAKK